MYLAVLATMHALGELRAKLCRELAQSERSADVHARREARRLGDVGPARAVRAVGEHVRAQRPRFDAIACKRQPSAGRQLVYAVGHMVSRARHAVFDRLLDRERAYRSALLGFRHGVDTARLLRAVAQRLGDERLVQYCDEWLPERLALIAEAEHQLAWFADVPSSAARFHLRTATAAKPASRVI